MYFYFVRYIIYSLIVGVSGLISPTFLGIMEPSPSSEIPANYSLAAVGQNNRNSNKNHKYNILLKL
jgi:hypothetical protein